MKKKMIELLKKRRTAGFIAVALAVAVGCGAAVQYSRISELPSYTDPVMEATIEEDETPLASQPKVDTKTSKSTSTKKVKMKKAAEKSYTKTLPATSSTSKKVSETSEADILTQTTIVKQVKEKYTKKSKVKVVTTETTTTVTVTTTAKESAANAGTATSAADNSVTGVIDVSQYASKADSRVLSAYEKLGFTVEVDASVSYSGYYNTRNRKITLRKLDTTIYHELGHFVAFISGNTDQSAEFKAIYNQEKSLYTASNKAYVTKSSAEYFAESFKDYTLNPVSLKASRPKTYAAVQEAVAKFTDDRIGKVQKVYSIVWR